MSDADVVAALRQVILRNRAILSRKDMAVLRDVLTILQVTVNGYISPPGATWAR